MSLNSQFRQTLARTAPSRGKPLLLPTLIAAAATFSLLPSAPGPYRRDDLGTQTGLCNCETRLRRCRRLHRLLDLDLYLQLPPPPLSIS